MTGWFVQNFPRAFVFSTHGYFLLIAGFLGRWDLFGIGAFVTIASLMMFRLAETKR